MHGEFTEQSTEGELIMRRDILRPKHQDFVLEECPVNDRELAIRERLREVKVTDLRAEIPAKACDFDLSCSIGCFYCGSRHSTVLPFTVRWRAGLCVSFTLALLVLQANA
jgi:hypothetical protein